MKKLIDKIYNWTQSLKKIVSDKMPKYDKDKTDHYKFVRIFTWPIGIWAIPFPVTGFWFLTGLLLFCFLIEFPKIIKYKFAWIIVNDSIKDFVMAVLAGGILWLHLYERVFTF